jgi:hypothetical protein
MTIAYNLGIPNAPNNPSTDQPNMKTNNDNIATYVGIDHVGFNTAGSGQHNQVTFNANNVPVPPVSPPILFTNTVATLPQLFFYSGDAAHSANQYSISGSGGTGSGGSTFLLGGLILKWGVVAATDNTTINFATASGAVFPNNCLGVQLTLYTASASSANAMILSVSPTPSNSAFTPRIRTSAGTTGSATIFYLAIGN